jgi:hypothetical protein
MAPANAPKLVFMAAASVADGLAETSVIGMVNVAALVSTESLVVYAPVDVVAGGFEISTGVYLAIGGPLSPAWARPTSRCWKAGPCSWRWPP